MNRTKIRVSGKLRLAVTYVTISSILLVTQPEAVHAACLAAGSVSCTADGSGYIYDGNTYNISIIPRVSFNNLTNYGTTALTTFAPWYGNSNVARDFAAAYNSTAGFPDAGFGPRFTFDYYAGCSVLGIEEGCVSSKFFYQANMQVEQVTGGGNFPGLYYAVATVVATATAVPEPTGTLALLILGTLGAASTLKRKLKSSKSIQKEIAIVA